MKANKKQKNTKKQRITKVFIFSILVPIVLIVIGYFVWRANERRLDIEDRKGFTILKQDMEVLSNRLESAGNTWRLGAACSRAHVVWGDGHANCGVSISSARGVKSQQEMEKKINAYNEILFKSNDLFRSSKPFKTPEMPQNSVTYGGGKFESKRSGIECYANYQVSKDGEYATLRSSFDCSGNARDTWFPRSDI